MDYEEIFEIFKEHEDRPVILWKEKIVISRSMVIYYLKKHKGNDFENFKKFIEHIKDISRKHKEINCKWIE